MFRNVRAFGLPFLFRKSTTHNPRSKICKFLLVSTCALYLSVAVQGVVLAQASRALTLNGIDSRGWPDMAINLTLTGPDGKAIPNVNVAQFQVSERGIIQGPAVLELGPAKNVPLALVLAIDVSGSMNADNKLNEAKATANIFLDSLRPQDTAALIAFDDQIHRVVDPTNDRAALQTGVNALQANGNTSIYDALYDAAQIINLASKEKRRAIILLTDGEDTSSHYGAVVAATVARDTGALVYTIGLGSDANDGVLRSLSQPSGGKYYKAPSAADLAGIYNAISIELDSQLFLNYKSSTTVDRSYELVQVEVKYIAPDGQALVKTVSYRPPPPAIKTSTPEPFVSEKTPLPTIVPVASSGGPGPNTIGQVSSVAGVALPSQNRIYSLGAAALAGIAVLFGMIALSSVLLPSATSRRVAHYVASAPTAQTEDNAPSFTARVITPFVESIGARLTRLSPRGYTDHIAELLTLMGPPYRMQVGSFFGIQLGLSVVVIILFFLWSVRSSPNAPGQWALAMLLGAAIGAYFPYFWLKRKVTERRRSLLRALPGALDFLAINVEAGLGFDAAMGQVVQRWRNTLTDELALLLIDFQIGKARKDAWRELIQRTQLPELTTFVTAMLQNEQVGASISSLLRTQADQMRIRRRQAAEEAARKAPVKLLFPLVFFILPGLFVVIIGPAVPQFMDSFLSFGR